MLGSLRGQLSALVNVKYHTAKASQSLIFSPTELAIIETGAGVPFQLRYCPALAKKPQKDDAAESPKNKIKKPDPFDNPDEALLITEIPEENPTHLLVLNKYPVIPGHFILATKQNKQQTAKLEQDDVAATYACLKSWEEGIENHDPRRLLAFFNSGEHSGASQAHRHVQFLPVEEMSKGGASSQWKMLIDLIEERTSVQEQGNTDFTSHPTLTFVHYGQSLRSNMNTTELYGIYTGLYKKAETAAFSYIQHHPESLELHPTGDGSNPISYNLAMTTSFMAIVPRRREGESLRRHDGSEIGFIALNGTVLAGTLMVKGEEEWEMLKQCKSSLDEILEAVGLPLNAVEPKSESNKL